MGKPDPLAVARHISDEFDERFDAKAEVILTYQPLRFGLWWGPRQRFRVTQDVVERLRLLRRPAVIFTRESDHG